MRLGECGRLPRVRPHGQPEDGRGAASVGARSGSGCRAAGAGLGTRTKAGAPQGLF